MAFSWSGVRPPVARGVAKAAGLNPASAAYRLQLKFGRVPDERFVEQMWDALRDEWLQRDRAVTKALANVLAQQGVVPTDVPVRNHEQRLQVLRSIPLDETVRSVVLSMFLAAHETEPTANDGL